MSRLVFKNNKMVMDENIKKLVISNNKTIIKEAIEDISLDSASALITDTVKSTVKISEAIIKNFIANTKFMIQVSLLPLTQNLDSVIKGYETDIANSNKLFLDSIPANVANTAKILSIPATSPAIVFEKMSQEMEKVEGVKEIIGSKLFSNINISGPVRAFLDGTIDTPKDIASLILKKAFKDLPEYLAGSAYSYNDQENKEIQELYNKLNSRGSSSDVKEGISGFGIKVNSTAEQFLLSRIINPIRTASSSNLIYLTKEAYGDKDPDAEKIANCIFSIRIYKERNSYPWKTEGAIPPKNNDTIVRFKYKEYYITIKKSKLHITSDEDLKECYLALDKDNVQVTNDVSFYDVLKM